MMQVMVVPRDKQAEEVMIERDAFGAFFAIQYERLGKAMYLLTGDIGEAEDLAQDAMVRVYERWDRVATMASPEGYLFRTALNLYRSRLRRAAVRFRRSPPPVTTDPLIAAEDRDDIGRLLRALPIGQREALVIIEWLGLTADEASKVLGIEPASVRARVSRAKTALRRAEASPEGQDR
jgi:RNA polymerase sigma-70 factor (ECF subfamily)